MKKTLTIVIAVVLCAVCVMAFVGCTSGTDYEKIQKKGYFIAGVTIAEPMNYKDSDGNWTGFDTEFAQAVAAKLGLEVRFQEIDWGQKYSELNSGSIDCIWNGFTANTADDDGIQRSDKVSLSYYYMNNEQRVVVRTADLSNYTSAADLAGKKAGAETGSAGASYVASVNADLEVSKSSQVSTLTDLISGAIDFVVMDKTLADSIIGQGDYAALSVVDAIAMDSEKYAIGMRKGSDFTEVVNAAIKELAEDGTLASIAAKYNLEYVVITDFE